MHRAPQFELAPDWQQPPGPHAHRDVSAVDVDSRDRVYLFTRFDDQVLVYEPDGRYIGSWGKGRFSTAHGLTVGADDRVYCVDVADHTVRAFTPDGELLMTLGIPGHASDTGYVSGKPFDIHPVECVLYPGGPFNRCTNLAEAPDGTLYVADGYGNCRVHKFSHEGRLLHSWGEIGTGPGEFHLPHGILVAADGRVLVADRENDRIQVFDPDGHYLDAWTNVQRPCDLAMDQDGLIYVAELWRPRGKKSFVHGVALTDQPGRVSVLAPDGTTLDRWGADPVDRTAPGNFIAPHSITVDSRGDVYVAEVTFSFAITPGWVPATAAHHQIQKFVRRP